MQAYKHHLYTENSLQVPIADLTTIEYNTILAGIVYGVIDKEGCTEIKTCIGDGKDEAELAYDAFQLITSGSWEDNVAGFEELVTVI